MKLLHITLVLTCERHLSSESDAPGLSYGGFNPFVPTTPPLHRCRVDNSDEVGLITNQTVF
jgi:hypothetical protein